MAFRRWNKRSLLVLVLAGLVGTNANQVLSTSGFTLCEADSTITVQNVNVSYDNTAKTVTFDVAGTSSKVMNVTAQLDVTAYGKSVYSNSFNPCAADTKVDQLCPVPAGSFGAVGTQAIPAQYADMIPSIAFSVPDIAAEAKLVLKDADGSDVACLQSSVVNGKTMNVPAVSYVAAGVAGAALVVTGASALAAGSGGAGAGHMSPSFTEVFTWFHGLAMNGMLSVNYPPVYRSFTKNFAFSTGIIPWTGMQTAIDNFRKATGGNLTNDSVEYLQKVSLNFGNGSNSASAKRSLTSLLRDVSTNVNSSTPASNSSSSLQDTVTGIKAYVEELSVPQSNTFMTVLLISAIVLASIAVSILAFKVLLETWALFASFPKKLEGFRKHYWGTMARTIVQLILVLYGVWVLYCIFQFTHGDSWAAQLLAALSLAIFTAVLAFFTFKIWQTARRLKAMDGDASGLYNDKNTWFKYSVFYDSYKKDYWWLFVPVIIYMAAKGCVIAAGDGHGLGQAVAQLIIECLMLGLLLWKRPYERRSGNVINIFIQVVRALSVICILVFVEELGISQTTQTVTGVVLIAVQSVLTGALAILIAVNAIILMCKENPHRKRRKEAEKRNRDLDNLTPLDARDSLLMNPSKMNTTYDRELKLPFTNYSDNKSFMTEGCYSPDTPLRTLDSQSSRGHRTMRSQDSRENLVTGAAPLGGVNNSPPRGSPMSPYHGEGGGYRGVAY